MPVSVTYTFTSGTLIESAQVNQNFDDLVSYLNGANISGSNLVPGSVTTGEIQDGTILLVDLDSEVTDAITGGGTTGRLLDRLFYDDGDDDANWQLETFLDTNYPTWNEICVKAVGGGGSGGGAAQPTNADEQCLGSFGGGGCYAEARLSADDIDSNDYVLVVGAGGLGIAGGADNVLANSGGVSSLVGTNLNVSAPGGEAGRSMQAASSFKSFVGGRGGGDAVAGTGDLVVPGSAGENGTVFGQYNGSINRGFAIPQGTSGESLLGAGVRAASVGDGNNGQGYGAGGSGGRNGFSSVTAQEGGDGSDGVVIIEVYG